MNRRLVRAGSFLCGAFVAVAGAFTLVSAAPEPVAATPRADLGVPMTPTTLDVAGWMGLRAKALHDKPRTVAAAPRFEEEMIAQPEEADDFALLETEAPFNVASGDASRFPAPKKRGGLAILQIGDSHTAADYFTGELRRILQKRFGDGGAGYLDAGKPHPGVRSAAMSVSASPGWTYSALQKSDDSARFHLSGFDAQAAHGGETLAFSSAEPISYDRIEVEVITAPGHGDIDIFVDNEPPQRRSLASEERGRAVFSVAAGSRTKAVLHKLRIATVDDRPVTVSGVGIFNRRHGVSYSNVGFPGATVDIVNKYDPEMLDAALKRLSPQIVVLAFGTNEGFNDDLDLQRYRDRYLSVIQKIREGAPGSRIVMVGPPHANRVPAACVKDSTSPSCKEQNAKATPTPEADAKAMVAAGDGAQTQAPRRAEKTIARASACSFQTPPRLDPVRELQRSIAKQEGLAFWDWAAIMPKDCGPDVWTKANPRLMTADHVHFTSEGYKVSATAFLRFLTPYINELRRKQYALSNN
jgi:lysophospholipase L1-like esterase